MARLSNSRRSQARYQQRPFIEVCLDETQQVWIMLPSECHGIGKAMVKYLIRCACKESGVIDDIPSAYKDMDAMMKNQKDLTETLHPLKQAVCMKVKTMGTRNLVLSGAIYEPLPV